MKQSSKSMVNPPRGAVTARHLPGEPGVWVFVFGDMTVFALFFGTYLYYRGQDVELFDNSQHTLSQGFGVANTIVLLCSSLAVFLGIGRVRRRRDTNTGTPASMPFVFALACGLLFTGLKTFEYHEKFAAGITPATNDFYMYYFVLTGLHLFHLLIGLAVLAYIVRATRLPKITDHQFAFIEGGACYWHMVDLIWLVLFALLYLVQ